MPYRKGPFLKPLLRRIFITAILFIAPSLYLQTAPEEWKSSLHTSIAHPVTANLKVTGLSHTSQSSTVRAALCITGHLRSFSRESIRQSIKEHVLAPLEDAQVLTDVFFHVGTSDLPRPGRSRARGEKSFHHAILEFNPTQISYFSNRRLPGPTRASCRATRRPIARTFPPALLRTEQCLDLIAREEKRAGVSYDWVYKTRPDIAFGANISTPLLLRNDTLYMNQHMPGTSAHSHAWLRERFGSNASVLASPVADQILVAARNIAEISFRAKQAFQDCDLYNLPEGTLNSEVGMTFWMVKNSIRYKALPWFWMLVRDVEGPECQRVQWIRDATGVHDPSLTHKCIMYKDTGQIPI